MPKQYGFDPTEYGLPQHGAYLSFSLLSFISEASDLRSHATTAAAFRQFAKCPGISQKVSPSGEFVHTLLGSLQAARFSTSCNIPTYTSRKVKCSIQQYSWVKHLILEALATEDLAAIFRLADSIQRRFIAICCPEHLQK